MLSSFSYDLSQVNPLQCKSLECLSPAKPILDDCKPIHPARANPKNIDFLKGDIAGQKIAGAYTIGHCIDKGNFGAIHSCKVEGSDRPLVIKVSSNNRMLGKEVAVLEKVSSPSFPSILKSGVFLWAKDEEQ